ncbi:MAG TPA: SufD family Fe-S cluster assembly protein, partial [Bacteroidia bacterium]|nr:SufD family Fe-S cluster assembly protein [Bacteroidia bacterium]
WDRFVSLPVPTRKNQDWRFADLTHLRFDGCALAEPVSSSAARQLIDRAMAGRPESVAAHFVFANNRLIHAETSGLPEGVVCLPIDEAIAAHPEQVRSHFLRQDDLLGGEKFSALHASADLSGLFVHASKGAVVEHPIVVHHFVGGANTAVFPQTLVIAEDHASVSVMDHFESIDGDEETLVVGKCDLQADRGGRLQYVAVQELSDLGAKYVHFQHTVAGRDAAAKVGFVNLGAEWVRGESVSRMLDTGADC